MKKIDLGQAKKDALGVLDKTKSAIAKAADQNNDENSICRMCPWLQVKSVKGSKTEQLH